MEHTGAFSERAAWLRRSPKQLRGALWAMRNHVSAQGAPMLEPRHRYPRVNWRGGRIELGREVHFRGLRFPVSLGVGTSGVLRIGDHCLCNQGTNIFAAELVDIGTNVKLGDLVTILDTNFHEIEPGAPVVCAPVVIGDNVWIGVNSIVLPGVTIGPNTVVGAGSLVAKSLPDGVLATGNPATIRRTLRQSDGWLRQ